MNQSQIPNNRPNRNGGQRQPRPQRPDKSAAPMKTNRGQALRASRRSMDTANKLIDIHDISEASEQRANYLPVSDEPVLKVIPLGGQETQGGRNSLLIEYGADAIVLDAGLSFGVDLPGINFTISDYSYLEQVKHKIRGYVFTHGHLDHIGAAPFVIAKYPAPIYGSQFTVGMVRKQFEDKDAALPELEDFVPKFVEMNMDNHERLKIGVFMVELVRLTHSIPQSAGVVIDTPAGRLFCSGDFRLDPEPLDHLPSDVDRLKQLGQEGVTLLMSESTTTYREGRTPTEDTLRESFHDLIAKAKGRVFVAVFSSNINRIQMIIDAAVAAGRKVALDGRSMLAHVELAVKLGQIRIPKGTLAAMRQMPNLPDNQILVVCTGGQGELNASLQRMSIGEHQHFKLKAGDSVVVSSTPIPGNEVRYEQIADDLTRQKVNLFRAPTHRIDGSEGPLHVSGHASREEFSELIRYMHPKYFMPIYGGSTNRKYHGELAVADGIPANNVFQMENGDVLTISAERGAKLAGKVPAGTVLVDQSGSIVPSVVVKDRIVLSEDGLVTVILTIERGSGRLLTSPDIISRGFIYMRGNEELVNGVRSELRRAVAQRFKRIELDRFKAEIKDHIMHYLFEHTQRSPVVIPVVNIVAPGAGRKAVAAEPVRDTAHD